MVRIIELPPSKIRFMHERINCRFSGHGKRYVNDVINDILLGLMSVYDLPKIRVVRKDGYYYAFDNRRLYVYRVLQHRGKLDTVKVKLASVGQFQPQRFSTKNNGKSVIVSRGITLEHSKATSPPSSPEMLSEIDDSDDDDIIYGFASLGIYDFGDSEDYDGFNDFDDYDDYGDYF